MQDNSELVAGFSFRYGQKVKIRPPHPEAGATGPVMNAYIFCDGREEVFVSVPGGVGIYHVDDLEPAPQVNVLRRDALRAQPGRSTEFGGSPRGSGTGRSTDVSGT